MPHDNRRPDRVAEAIREEVATFLADGVKDPRVRGLVTVTGVDVTRDLRHAKVFVSIMGSDAEKAATLDGLSAVAAHLRGRLGRSLRLRVAPEIAFRQDQSVEKAARIETLLEQIRVEREGRPGEAPDVVAAEGATVDGALSADDRAADGRAADGRAADAPAADAAPER